MRSYDKVLRVVKRVGLLSSIKKVLNWDSRVMMSKGALVVRSEELIALSTAIHRSRKSMYFGKNIRNALTDPQLTTDEKALLLVVQKQHVRARRVKQSLMTKREKLFNEATYLWEDARKKNDFSIFAPTLKKIIAYSREYAKSIDSTRNPYEVLLEEYEAGLSLEEINSLLKELTTESIKLLALQKEKELPHILTEIDVKTRDQFNSFFAEKIGVDLEKARIDRSDRAFASWMGRIAIRKESNWLRDLFTLLHEGGHSMYTNGLDLEHYGTPLGAKLSIAVDESQALIWQNFVGRTRAFWDYFFPLLKENYKFPFDKQTVLDYIDKVEAGEIRTTADELTYNIHIYIRFEIERDLMEGKIRVEDLPKIWNEKMETYLGVRPSMLSEGLLQDIHWAKGFIGYFPTYSLGSIFAAQLFAKAQEELDLNDLFQKGNFHEFRNWLREKVHRHGQRYSTKELIRKATGKEISSQDLINYLKLKYDVKKN